MAVPESEPLSNTHQALLELGSAESQRLSIDGIDATTLAAQFGTPLYAFSSKTLQARVAHIRATVGPRFELLWSIKANPSIAVTDCIRRAGAGCEIASVGELEVALAAGHQAHNLRFAGPGKTDQEIVTALEVGLGTFHIESIEELQRLIELGSAHPHKVGIALRVNLPQELAGSRMRMGGRSSRFGIDAELVPEAVRMVKSCRHLELRGLHVYGGTQCFDANAFVAHARALADHAAMWEHELDVRLPELDLGGGFGVAAFEGDPTFDLDLAAQGLADLLRDHDRPNRRWFLELGRYLAAPAGIFLTRVTRTKTSGDQRHVVVDGGMHQAAAAAGFGTIMRRPPLIVAADQLKPGILEPVTVGGPLCTPADQFADQLPLPKLQTGDLVAILNTGAYGLTYSPAGFLSHASPPEVMIENGAARVIRNRGTAKDALRGQLP